MKKLRVLCDLTSLSSVKFRHSLNSSDLDKATQMQLARGEKLTELLKQPQYKPMPFERQVLVIYAATNGFVDEVPTEKLLSYEAGLVEYFEARYDEVLQALRENGKLTDDIVAGLKKGIEEFTSGFAS